MPCATHVIGFSTRRKLIANLPFAAWAGFAVPAVGARTVPTMPNDLLGEHAQAARHEPRHTVGMLAGAAPFHHREPARQVGLGAAGARAAGDQLGHRARDRVETVHTRPALPGVLIREPARRAGQLGQRARATRAASRPRCRRRGRLRPASGRRHRAARRLRRLRATTRRSSRRRARRSGRRSPPRPRAARLRSARRAASRRHRVSRPHPRA